MEAIRVNADYEVELFSGGPGPRIVNESLEFLAFFLVKSPILSQKKYLEEYLNYVEEITGLRPTFVTSGKSTNWWGRLSNLLEERWLNSKITSTELSIEKNWTPESFIIKTKLDTPSLKPNTKYLVKDPFEMSGRGFKVISDWEPGLFKGRPLIIEPLLDRKYDFSHYVFPDGNSIVYENVVDSKFQFKGALFISGAHKIRELSFYQELEEKEWESFNEALEVIKKHYKKAPSPGYSIDSFIYERDGKKKIHFISEVNARRTMGLTAYEIGQKFSQGNNCCALILGKSLKGQGGFGSMKEKLKTLLETKKVIILSPGDVRFEILFLMGENREAIGKISQEIHSLLPEGEFPLLANT